VSVKHVAKRQGAVKDAHARTTLLAVQLLERWAVIVTSRQSLNRFCKARTETSSQGPPPSGWTSPWQVPA